MGEADLVNATVSNLSNLAALKISHPLFHASATTSRNTCDRVQRTHTRIQQIETNRTIANADHFCIHRTRSTSRRSARTPSMIMHQSKGSMSAGGSGEMKRKPSRLVRAITNPNEVLSGWIPQPKPQDPNAKRLEDFKLARALGGFGVDYGIGEPDKPKELPPAESPIFLVVTDSAVEDKLPRGYNMRSLQRDDYDRGYTNLKSVGPITLAAWNERCEYLRKRNDVYTILVITDNEDRIVATGTLMLERKFSGSMTTVGHIEDLAVGEGQSGKNLGLRLLDQLDRLALNAGCVRSVLGTQEQNEAFHKQKSESERGS